MDAYHGLTQGSDFNPHVLLLQSSVLFIKLALRPDIDSLGILDFAAIGFKHAYQAELETNRPQVLLLDELDNMIQGGPGRFFVRPHYSIPSKDHEDSAQYYDFFAMVIRNGLYHYAAYKIECQPDVMREDADRPLLRYVLDEWSLDGDLQLSSKMVDLLMRNGAYQISGSLSAWEYVLEILVSRSFDDADGNISSEVLKIVQIFIENGAVVNKEIYEQISRTFEHDFPEDTKRLQDLMVAKGALQDETQSSMATIDLSLRRRRRKRCLGVLVGRR